MKYLAFIISVYMTLIILLPCQDSATILTYPNQISTFSKPVKATSDSCGQEVCPPFCSCACCSVSRALVNNLAQKLVVTKPNIPYCNYRMPAIAEQLIEIDQPPQIG